MSRDLSAPIGPILFLDDVWAVNLRLTALFITEKNEAPPSIELATDAAHPVLIAEFDNATVWRVRFALPADRPPAYSWNGDTCDVASDLTGDLRLAYPGG